MENNEFRLHYQPVLDLSTEELVGFEVLIRWQHPERGLLLPGEFMPLAEECGLTIPIGWWVVEQASRCVLSWQRLYPQRRLFLSVNMSIRQVLAQDLVDRLAEILARAGMPPTDLKIEIKEQNFLGISEAALNNLSSLSKMGIRVEIDNFGSSYSRLSDLNQLPIHAIKIGRDFTARIGYSSGAANLVRSMIMLARNLGLEATAEGIETTSQMACLHDLHCRYGQGLLISRPLEASEVVDLLVREPGGLDPTG